MNLNLKAAIPRIPMAVALASMLLVPALGSEVPPPGPKPAIGADKAAPLETALSEWRQGNKDRAVERFLKIDWKSAPVLSAKSPLAALEKDLPGMAAAHRDKLMAEVMSLLKDLKQLANAVKEKGAATPATDSQSARLCFTAIDQCGTALNRPDSLRIVQLTAQSLRKMAATELPKLGK